MVARTKDSFLSFKTYKKHIILPYSKYSEFFSRTTLKQRLNEAINLICENLDETLGTKDRVMKALLKSQGYSLEGKKIANDPPLNPIQIINLSTEDYIIIGSKNILSAILSLIEIATIENNILLKVFKKFSLSTDIIIKFKIHMY